ncbi:MAG: hypothetical protein ACOX52_06305 [Verrucomicrobiota bacterium]|jgi:hypothetical protein
MIEQALASSDSAELLVTWADCAKKKPKRRLDMNPQELLGDEFPLEEQDFVVFRRNREHVEQADALDAHSSRQ